MTLPSSNTAVDECTDFFIFSLYALSYSVNHKALVCGSMLAFC
jgi:hypothetical protein